ncbi:MAG: sensor histidine kinase [Magnetococcales bacterium]|nr:sensor histidine kinase [Magnetococcales bacterium]
MTMEIKPETGLTGLLEAFDSSHWPLVREAVEQTGGVLRQVELDAATHARIGSGLIRLVEHPKWEVRKALAHAALYLRHETFDRMLAVLGQDNHDLVRNAARRTLSRRSELSRTDLLKEQHGDLMLKWLQDLEERHGMQARNAVRKVAEKLQAQFIKELHHEMIKVISPLDASLEHIDAAIQGHRINRETLGRHARRAKERVKFLVAVLDSLYALTRERDLEFQTESLLSLMEEAVHLVRDRKPENAGLYAEFRIDPEITVEVNRHLLLQALTNIIQNSMEAYAGTQRAAEIAVAAIACNGARIQMTITDYGCGMSEEAVGDAFQLFATSKPHGTGFGLTMAKKIIESDHGGSVLLESAKGRGTKVIITLPREQEEREW